MTTGAISGEPRKVRRSEVKKILADAETTLDQLKRMVGRLGVFTDHLDAIAAEFADPTPALGGGAADDAPTDDRGRSDGSTD